jgi:hypothetical protein
MLSDPKDIIDETENNGHGQYTERPEEVLLTDRPILLTVISWILTVFMILLLKHNAVIQ